ncbi:MAG: DUF1549 domain-containing protein [Planctomycetota bacterium]|nr:DUF1549 domain-containing protein [Planctomycetota bacterium]
MIFVRSLRFLTFHPLGLILTLVAFIGSPVRAADKVDFAHEIVPVLRKHCGKCHSGAKKQGGFSFNTRNTLLKGGESGPAVVPSKSGDSKLLERITSTDPDLQMPPEGARVPEEDIARIREWIDAGLPWEDGFAFEKNNYEPPLRPRRPELPPVQQGRDNPIDRLIDARSGRAQDPLATAPDAAFIRRATLDLTGLLPTPERLAEFLNDKRPDRRAKLVDELLANDVAYADHWLTFWNDLLRNDYTGTGFITGGRKQITTWLHRSLVENKPYDLMVRELISPTPESEGFIQGIRWRGEVSASQTNEVQFSQSISQALLGINMKCASCHDSFIDRWKLSEAFGLAAIYASEPLAIYRCDKATGETAKASWLFPELGQIDPKASQPERMKQLAALMTHPENGRLSRTIVNRLWERLLGMGIVHPVDAMNTEPRFSDLLDFLAVDFADHKYDLKHTLRLIANSKTYQQRVEPLRREDSKPAPEFGPQPRRLTAEQFVDAVWQITSASPAKPDAAVARSSTKTTGEKGAVGPLRAKWIWSKAEASAGAPAGEAITVRTVFELPAAPTRAAAVITCDNDYVLFVNGNKVAADGNWESLESVSLTEFLRKGANRIEILATNGGADPNPAGLMFEARILVPERDPLVVATGEGWNWTASKLDGNGRFAKEPTDWKPVAAVSNPGVWAGRFGEEAATALAIALDPNRPMVRASLVKSDYLQRTLGRPNRDQIVTSRPTQFTTLEALELANGDALKSYVEVGAKNLAARFAGRPDELIDWLFLFATSEPPAERKRIREFLGPNPDEQAIEDLLWTVFMLDGFQYVR